MALALLIVLFFKFIMYGSYIFLYFLYYIIFQLLERREQQMISRTQKPVIVELYEEMRKYMDNGTQLMPTYLKMVDSLRYYFKFKAKL